MPSAETLAEQRLVDRWVRSRIIDHDRLRCLHCRLPILFGSSWVELPNGEGVVARFHKDCVEAWLELQRAAARRALGISD